MLNSQECQNKFGDPTSERNMTIFHIPEDFRKGVIPPKIYCNVALVNPLRDALKKLINTGAYKEIEEWNGCFNIRTKKGGSSPSLHSWGLAIDINASSNGYGDKPTLSKTLVECFESSGFDWGGHWKKPDGMHFQLKSLDRYTLSKGDNNESDAK